MTLHVEKTRYSRYIASRAPVNVAPLNNYRANPLGMTCAVMSSDGKFLASRRSFTAEQNPGKYYFFGGYPEFDDSFGEVLNLKCEILREAQEELGIQPASVLNLRILGIAYDALYHHPEIFALMSTSECANKLVANAIENGSDELSNFEICDRKRLAELSEEIGETTWSFTTLVGFIEKMSPVYL